MADKRKERKSSVGQLQTQGRSILLAAPAVYKRLEIHLSCRVTADKGTRNTPP